MSAPLTSPLGGDDLAKALRDAYGRGFSQSGEGYNSEHPGDTHEKKSWQNDRDAWIAQYIARLPAAEPKGACLTAPGSCPTGDAPDGSSSQATAIPSRKPALRMEGPWPRTPTPGRHPDGSTMIYDIPWIKDWRTVTGRTLEEGMKAHQNARGALSDAITAHGWRPIATAPKDGTCVLLGFAGDPDNEWCAISGWFERGINDQCWYDVYHGEVSPTHWMPLPPAPVALAGEARRAETEGLGSRASDGEAGTPEATPKSSPDQTPVDPQMTVEEAREFLRRPPKVFDPKQLLARAELALRTLQAGGEVR